MAYVTIHAKDAVDFTTLGLGIINPTQCYITEKAGNYCELSATLPIEDAKSSLVTVGAIVCAEMPLRESPEIDVPGGSGDIERQVWVNRTSVALSLYSKPAAGVRVASLASGEECQKISEVTQSGTTFFRVAKMGGGSVGYIPSANLQNTGRTVIIHAGGDNPSGTVTITLARRQPFRIYKTVRDSQARTISINAHHLTYDLGSAIYKHNMPSTSKYINDFWETYSTSSYMTPDVRSYGYEVKDYTNIPFKTSAKFKTVIEVLCETGGALEQVDGCLMRDGTTLYILPKQNRNSGYEIRVGKNLLSASLTEDTADVITAIRPYGKKSDGTTPLYGELVTASNVADFGPFARVRYIEYNVKATDSTTAAENAAKAKLAQLAQADLDGSADALNTPTKDVSTSFFDVYSTAAYAAIANSYKLHLYDMVRVYDPDMGINVSMMLSEYSYNCLSGEYTKVKLETLKSTR